MSFTVVVLFSKVGSRAHIEWGVSSYFANIVDTNAMPKAIAMIESEIVLKGIYLI